MKTRFNKVLSLMLATVVALGTFAFSTGSVFASEYELNVDDPVWLVGNTTYHISVHDNDWNEATITSARVSNKSIAKLEKNNFSGEVWWGVYPKKAGKVTIVVKYKTKEGKKGTAKKTVSVKKYPNQIKSLTINGKKVNVKKNKDYFSKEFTGTNAKIKVALKDNWEFSSDDFYCDISKTNGKSKYININKSTLLKGKAISFPKKYSSLYVQFVMRNKKTGDKIRYSVNLYRK